MEYVDIVRFMVVLGYCYANGYMQCLEKEKREVELHLITFL